MKKGNSSIKKGNRSRQRHSKPRQSQKYFRISDHFEKKEFMCKSGLSKKLRISAGLIGCLEYLQSKTTNRIKIIKGYECQESAEKQKRLKRNYHSQGLAVNITIENMSLEEIFRLSEPIEEFTTIGINYDENHIHLCRVKGRDRECWMIKNHTESPVPDTLFAPAPPQTETPPLQNTP
jgi:hypothetical protein